MVAPIFRAPMRPRDRCVPAGAGSDHGLSHGLVGIGDALDPVPATLDEAVERCGGKAGRMLRRFAELPLGTFVWTRTGNGLYRLGRVAGPWRYDQSVEAAAVGIHHVRSATWLPNELDARETPAAVQATFARGGRNLQRIRDDQAERRTERLWRGACGPPPTSA